jgi:aspartyl/asparaginyl beta-hydroxylase (cupin superfamily)
MEEESECLRRMARQCREMAMTREIDELREVFLRMAERYDESANVQDTGSPVAQHNIGGLAAEG